MRDLDFSAEVLQSPETWPHCRMLEAEEVEVEGNR